MSTKNYSRASYHLAETKSISSPSLQKKVTIVKTKESPTARFAESGFEQSSHYNRTIKELQSVIDKAEAKKFSTSSFHYSPSQYEEEIICEPSTKDIVVHVPRTVGSYIFIDYYVFLTTNQIIIFFPFILTYHFSINMTFYEKPNEHLKSIFFKNI